MCKTIINEKVVFAFLQEVVSESETIIRQLLETKFDIFSGNVNNLADYYTLTLVAKMPFIKVLNNEIIYFKNTYMGRNIIQTIV